jgi:hypothetical protein
MDETTTLAAGVVGPGAAAITRLAPALSGVRAASGSYEAGSPAKGSPISTKGEQR